MKKFIFFPIIFFIFILSVFFRPFLFENKLPVPSDTIVGLYFPFRDVYAKEYPRGIPFKNFQITDPVRQQYPWKTLTIDSFKSLQLPLWNPYNFSGTPLLANMQSGVFYPLNMLFFILPFQIGWSVFIALQPLLAMVFMYFFLKNLRLSNVSSIFGAIAFAFCGFFVSWMEWGNVVNTGLWLPLILLAVDRLTIQFDYSKIKISNSKLQIGIKNYFFWSFILLISLIFSFFAGHLQIFFYEFLVALAYFFIRWIQVRKNKRILLLFLLITLLFFLLTAIQWIPTLKFILLSARDIDQNWHNAGWFVPWQNLTQFIAPDFFGNPSTLNYWGVWNYGEFISYIGFLPFLFAIYAMCFPKRGIIRFFIIVLMVSLIFALPTLFAKIPFKFSLPFLSTSQPTRLIFLADISLCILAAFGFEYFLQNKKKILIPFIILGVIFILFWGFVFSNQNLPQFMQITSDNLAVTKNNLKLPTLLYIFSVIIIGFYLLFEKRFKFAKKLFIIMILLITVFDLYRFTTKYITFAEKKYLFPQTKILSYLQQQEQPFRVMSTDSRVFPPNFSIMYKIETPDGYDPLFLRSYAELSAATARGVPNIFPPFGFNRIITVQNYHSDLINLLNIKYILSLEKIDSAQFKEVMKEGETRLYENLNVVPRAFFASTILYAENNQEAIKKLYANSKHLDLVAVVVGANNLPTNVSSMGQADITLHEANKVIINTNNIGTKLLVLTDTYYPSWHAKICFENGSGCKETNIYRADYNFRGVIVPPGKHSVIFYNTLL